MTSKRLDDVINAHILAVIAECGNNVQKAALVLGVDRTNLYRRMKSFGIWRNQRSKNSHVLKNHNGREGKTPHAAKNHKTHCA